MASIGFPGFSQGAAYFKEQRLTYPKIAEQTLQAIFEATGIELEPLDIKAAVETLCQQRPMDVVNVRRTMRPLGVRVVVDTASSGIEDVAGFFQDYLKKVGISLSRADARQLVTQSDADDILLHWTKLDVATRISMFDFGSEILFLWRSGGASSTTVDEVLKEFWTAKREHRGRD